MKNIIVLLFAVSLSCIISCQHKVDLVNPDIIKSDAAGNLYVMQRYDRIIKSDRNNRVLFEIGKKDRFQRNYSYPWQFDLAADGRIYVLYVTLDYRTGKTVSEQIVRYTSAGKLDKVVYQVFHTQAEMENRDQAYAFQGMTAAGNNIRAVVAQTDGNIELLTIDPDGSVLARSALDIYTVGGMCVSREGTTILTDMARNEAMIVNDSGTVTRRFGATGTAPGFFRSPAAVCTDDQGHIYICDQGNRRVQKFTRTGELAAVFNSPAMAPGTNDLDLRGIACVDGDIHVIEFLGKRVLVYGQQGEFKREIAQLTYAGFMRVVHLALLILGVLLGAALLILLLRFLFNAFQQKIGVRLVVLFAGAGVVVVCAVSMLIYSISYKNYEKELREKFMTISQMLAAGTTYEEVAAVKGPDDDNYQTLLEKFKMVVRKSSNIDWIGVYLVEGDHLYYGIDTDETGMYTPLFKVSPQHLSILKNGRPGYFEYADETGEYLSAVAPVLDSAGMVRTTLEVSCDLGFLKQYRKAVLYNVLWVSLACLAVFCLISVLLSLTITRPIKELTLGALAVEEGIYDYRLQSKHRHEVGRFIATFNEMMASLAEKEKIRSIMNKVVSKEVAHELLKNKMEMGGSERRASILFTDIRGFTTIAETMEPADLVTMLNEYFSRMSPQIDKEGGVIDKYIGDAIMAIFGAPLEFPDDAIRAVRAGVAMLKDLRVFNAERAALRLPPITIGVGINSGMVVAGNIGSENRLNYTIIGDAVNLASRLEGLTKYYGVSMIVSEEVAVQTGDRFVVRQLDVVRVMGKRGSVKIFEVITADEERWAGAITLFDQAVRYYLAQQWDRAEALFNKVLALEPADKPSGIYLARIAEYRVAPPSADWDGVYSAVEK